MVRPALVIVAVVVVVAGVSACGGGGSLAITASAGVFGEGDGSAVVFVDDADVALSRLLVSFGDLTVKGGEVSVGGPVVVDLHAAGPTPVATFDNLDGGAADVSAAIVPADAGEASAANVDDDDLAFMADNGFSVFIAGDAVIGGGVKSFAWGFANNTRYVDCVDEDGDPSVVVTEGAITEWQLTLQAEQLFADNLVENDAAPVLRFAELAAADANDDGSIDVDELVAVDLDEVAGEPYRGAGADVVTLFDFLAEKSRTLLRSNIDGRCTAEKR